MDIKEKSDFTFVTQDALRCITIDGHPYPIRNASGKGVLPILGDDFAYLQEALLERKFLSYEPLSSLNESALDEAKPTYSERILKAPSTFDSEHNEVVSTMKKSWYNRNELASLNGITVARIAGAQASTAENEESVEMMKKAEKDHADALRTAEQNRLNADSNAENEYKAELKNEEDAWNKGAAVTAREKQRDDEIQSEASRHNEAVDYEKKRHDDNLAAINNKYESTPEDKDIDFAQWDRDLKMEDERHINAGAAENNAFVAKCESLITTCAVEVEKLVAEHEAKVAEIENKFADEKDRSAAIYDAQVEKARVDYFEAVSSIVIGRRCDWLFDNYVCVKGAFDTLHQRAVQVANAAITTSCAHKWYERAYLYRRASTPLNRTFADLERMTTRILSYGGPSVPNNDKWATCPIFVCGAYSVQYQEDLPSYKDEGPIGGSSFTTGYPLAMSENTIKADDCYFVFGRRSEVERVEKIVADIWQYRYEKDEDSTNEMRDNINREYSIQRVEFARKDEPAKQYTDMIDAIADQFQSDMHALEENRDERISAVMEAYDKKVVNIEQKRAERDKAFDAELNEKIADVHKTRIATMEPVIAETNTKIIAFEMDADNVGKYPAAIWADFFAKDNEEIEREREAVEEAKKKYNEQVAASDATYQEEIATARDDMDAEKATIIEDFNGKSRKLKDDAQNKIANVHDLRTDAWNEINATYSRAIAAASDAFDSALDAAKDSAARILSDAGANQDNWEFLVDGYGIRWKDGYSPSSDEDAAMENAASLMSTAYENATQSRAISRNEAERQRWESRKTCPVIRTDARVRFSAKIEPFGTGMYSSQEFVNLVQVANVTVYYKPKSMTGMDVSAYEKELDEEKEEAKKRKAMLASGDSAG